MSKGTLRSHDSDGGENAKSEFTFFQSLSRLFELTLSNVRNYYEVEFQRSICKFRKSKKISYCTKHEISQAVSTRRHTVMVKKIIYKKEGVRAKLLFCLILTLLFF